MKRSTLAAGAIAGITALTLAIPVFAQSSTGSPSSPAASFFRHMGPATQQHVQDMIAKDDAFLQNIDAFVTIQKNATQAHKAALTAAAALTDDTARQTAVAKAQADLRAAMQAALTANPHLKGIMPLRDIRGHGSFGIGKGMGMHSRGADNDRDQDDQPSSGTTSTSASAQ